MRRPPAIFVVVFTVIPMLISAADPTPQGSSSRGTATLGGMVVASDSGVPIARAAVTIAGLSIPGFTTLSDAAGRFEFDRLPAGSFTLTASKNGLLRMAYGQAAPGRGSGVPVDLKDGERRDDLRWSLPRASIITGRVLDESGRPMRGAIVVLQQQRFVDGEPRLVACCGDATADADGLYRLTGLMPGDYAVSAMPPGEYAVIPQVLSTYGEETRRTTDDEVRWALREAEIASGRSAPGASRLPEPPLDRSISYGRIYYPGTPDPVQISMVTVEAGEERRGIDFSMTRLPTAFIGGRVMMPDGQPPAEATLSFSDGWSTSTAGLPSDGRFERRNLLPGKYTITARVRTAALWGSRAIEVNGVDVPDVAIALGPAASIRGTVIFEDGDAPPPNPSAVSVSLVPLSGTTPARVDSDGRFSFPIVDAGRYRFGANVGAANRERWLLKSAIVSGVDALDTGFVIDAGQSIADVVVTFTTRMASLSGTLSTADGSPAAGFYVVAFADDPAKWSPRSRRVPAPVRASTDGRFEFRGLAAGTYRLAALTSVDNTDLDDPEFLAALRPGGTVVTIADGEAKTQDLRFARR